MWRVIITDSTKNQNGIQSRTGFYALIGLQDNFQILHNNLVPKAFRNQNLTVLSIPDTLNWY